MTKHEAIERLRGMAREIAELTHVLEHDEASSQGDTAAFLEKCGGWEDDRTAEQIASDIYEARVNSESEAGRVSD